MLEYEKHITKHCGISETQICLNKCKCGALTNREQCYSCWRKTHLSKDWLKNIQEVIKMSKKKKLYGWKRVERHL